MALSQKLWTFSGLHPPDLNKKDGVILGKFHVCWHLHLRVVGFYQSPPPCYLSVGVSRLSRDIIFRAQQKVIS